MTVKACAALWLKLRMAQRSPKNRKIAETRARKYLVPFLGRILVSDLTATHLRQYRQWLEGQGLSPGTIRNVLGDARNLLNWAVEDGQIQKSPFPPRLLPRVQERAPDRLTEAEVNKLLTIPNPWRFVIELGLQTGLRWSELCRVRGAHVSNQTLIIPQSKSGKIRRIPLSAKMAEQIILRDRPLARWREVDPGHFNRQVKELSGIQKFHAHMLRHTFACHWLEAGGSLAALQELLGHASIQTTQRYARLADDMIRREAERILTKPDPH